LLLIAAGGLNSATRVPVTADSLFQVGSITKIWTATMIMQLADEGQLPLDTPVAEVPRTG
jgi:CubicO group peptidase (beta-lactamase class C family)